MSWERLWRLPVKRLDGAAIRTAATEVAASYAQVRVEVEWEEDDIISCFFDLPRAPPAGEVEEVEEVEENPDDPWQIELSVYDLGKDGIILSLEGEAADNDTAFDDACQIAEDLAEALGATPMEL